MAFASIAFTPDNKILDGNSIVLMTSEKVELNSPKDKKK